MSRKTGVVQDKRYLEHGAGFDHPESPARLAVIYDMLAQPDMSDKFIQIPARPATVEELALVHQRSYIDLVAATAGKSFTSPAILSLPPRSGRGYGSLLPGS